jgi:hypothetical protein
VNEELGSKIQSFRCIIRQDVFVSQNNDTRAHFEKGVSQLYSCPRILSSTICIFFIYIDSGREGLSYCIEIRWLFSH